MVQSLQLGTATQDDDQKGMRRLNRLPIIAAIIFIVLFIGVVVIGLSWRGLPFGRNNDLDRASNTSASTYGDKLKQGVSDGIIGEPEQREVFQPTPAAERQVEEKNVPAELPRRTEREERRPKLESRDEWLARLEREQEEQYIREKHRQNMARLQARAGALDSPVKVDISDLARTSTDTATTNGQRLATAPNGTSDLYAAAMKSGLLGQNVDQNGQTSKEDFFNQDIKDLGYLPNRVVPQFSPYELKRGSVIPATLITGLNSDLPGRITAQVSQNVYDSATGYRLLIPQGAKLFGRYDFVEGVIWPKPRSRRVDGPDLPERLDAANRRHGRHGRGRLWRVQGQGGSSPLANIRLGRSRRDHRDRDRYVLARELDARDAGHRIRCRKAQFRGILRPRRGADNFEEPQRAADDSHSSRLQIQRPRRPGRYLPRRLRVAIVRKLHTFHTVRQVCVTFDPAATKVSWKCHLFSPIDI